MLSCGEVTEGGEGFDQDTLRSQVEPTSDKIVVVGYNQKLP